MQRATSRQLWSILAASHVVCNEGECRGGRGEGRVLRVEGRGEGDFTSYFILFSSLSPFLLLFDIQRDVTKVEITHYGGAVN